MAYYFFLDCLYFNRINSEYSVNNYTVYICENNLWYISTSFYVIFKKNGCEMINITIVSLSVSLEDKYE